MPGARCQPARVEVEKPAREALGTADRQRVRTPALLLCDMASQSSIRVLANRFRKTHSRLESSSTTHINPSPLAQDDAVVDLPFFLLGQTRAIRLL